MEGDNFVSQFHTLDGITVDERRRNLFRLLKSHSSLAVTDLDRILSILEPRNHLERIFWLDSLIYFKRFDELFKEFQNGDNAVICKIMKQSWFFDTLFTKIEPENFVNHVLPTISFAARLKVLKKLRLNEEKSEKVFDALHRRYGVFVANNVLHRCSDTKIRKILEEEPVKLTPGQLKMVLDKGPSLIILYFEQIRKLESTPDWRDYEYYSPILVYAAQKDSQLFVELLNRYRFGNIRIGRRTTKKFVKAAKKEVISNPCKFFGKLCLSSMVKALGDDCKHLIPNLLPEHAVNLPHSLVYIFLAHFSKNERFNLYKSAYNATYFKKFGEDINLVLPDELKLITDFDERQSLAKRLMDNKGNEHYSLENCLMENKEDTYYLKYLDAPPCFEDLKGKFDASTTVQQKGMYVKIMTKSCVLNQDLDSLLEILQLLKNYGCSVVLLDVLKKVFKSKSFAKKLTKEHWSLFYEMLTMNDVKKDFAYVEYLFKYVEFLFNNNMSINDVVHQVGCEVLEQNYLNKLLGNKPKLLKAVLLELIEIDLNRTEESLRLVHVLIIYATLCYNKQNPKNKIFLGDNSKFFETCEYILVNKTTSYSNDFFPAAVSYMITTKCELDQIKRLQELFFESYRDLGCDLTLLWFLKNSPELVQRYFDRILENLGTKSNFNDTRIWEIVKKYSNLDLDRRAIQFCLANLENKNYDKLERFINPLSLLMTASDYVEFAKSCKMTTKELETKNDDTREKLKIQLLYLKNMNPPETGLPTVLEFCADKDYLRATSLSVLYSLVHRTPENKLKKFIEQLQNFEDISLKKHGVILTCTVLDQVSVLTCLKNTSVPSFRYAKSHFEKNPSDELWEFLKHFWLKIDKGNPEMLNLVTKITVSSRFRDRYNEILWDIFTCHQQPQLLKEFLPKLSFDNVSFCSKIIKETFLKFDEAKEFAVNFLINTSKVDVIVEVLENFKKDLWNFDPKPWKSQEKLRSFVAELLETYMQPETEKKDFATEFLAKFQKIFTTPEAFFETVLLSLMTVKGESTEDIAKFVINLSRDLIKTFGQIILDEYAKVISRWFIYEVFFRNAENIQFCYELFKFRQSVDDDLLIIKLLPDVTPGEIPSGQYYESMMKVWQASNDPLVQLQLSLHVDDLVF